MLFQVIIIITEMSDWDGEEICLILAFCCLLFLIFTQWNTLKCILCVATNTNNNNRNFVEGQFGNHEPSQQFQGSDLELLSMMIQINSLPITQFKKNVAQQMPINVDCAICLGEFEEEEWLKVLPNCNHGFHVSCIDTWFRCNSNCPLCRSRVHRVLVANNPEISVSFNTWLEILGMDDISIETPSSHFQSHSL